MFDTYRLMYKNNQIELNSVDLSEVAFTFQKESNKLKKNQLYANAFCRLFPMMLKNQKTFATLTTEDKIEICLCVLLWALNTYKNKKIKFSSYFCTCLKNHLLTYDNKQKTLKRRAWLNVSHENEKITHILTNTPIKSYITQEKQLLKRIIDSESLTTTEKEYCACVIAGYTKSKEINNKLNLATRIKNVPVTDPNHEKINNRLGNQVRVRLKQKLKNEIKK